MAKKQQWFGKAVVASLCLAMLLSVSLAVHARTLSVWVGDGDRRLAEYKIVADLFEAENPGITVDLQLQSGNQTQVMEKLALAIAGGAPPDVTWIEGSGVVEFAARGLLTDLTSTLSGLQFVPADTIEMTFDGKLWGVPYHTAIRGLFKNADLFEQAGLDPNADPASLDELYEWNKRLTLKNADGAYTQVGMIPWVGNWGAPGWIWTFGGELTSTNGSRITPTATHPKNIEAFAWLRNFAQFYGSPTPLPGAGFRNNNVAMSTESTSAVGVLNDDGMRFTTSRVPSPPGGKNGTWGGGTAVAVPMGAPNLELALKLARFFGEASTQVTRFNTSAAPVLPANWQSLLQIGPGLSSEWQPLLEQFPEAQPRTPLWITYFVNQLNPAMNTVVNGTRTPEQALSAVQVVMETLFMDLFGQ